MRLGEIQKLKVCKKVDFGVYLCEEDNRDERVLLPKKVAIELFREAKKYRQNADLVKLEDHALDAVTGGTDAFQTVLCRYGLHRPGRQVNECSFVCACCGKTFAVAMQETDPSLQTGVWDKKP